MSNNNAEGEEEEGRRRNNDADEREDNNANEGDNPVNEMEQLLANLQLFVGVYAFDDIEVHRRHRTSITNEQIYPYLENRGGEGGGRPNTASQPISPAVFDLFEERKVDESVRKRGYSNHEEGYEVLIEEATDVVGNNYESLTGSEAASLLYMFDADNSSGIKPASKRQRIVQCSMRDEKPSSNLFQQLIPSTEPPTPDDPDFDDFVKKTILDDWGIWDYIKDDDRVNYLYQSNQGSFEGDNADLHLRYAILTTDISILPDSQRNNISIVVKDIGNYTVFEILSIWFASDNCIRKYCKGSEVRNIWLKNHPYPIGRDGIDDISDSKTKIKKFYKHANVILALYIYQVITAFKEGRLRAFKTAVGLQVHGPHWIILNHTMNGSIRQASVSGVGRVVQVIRLAGFAHSVVGGYHHKISDDDADYTIDGVTYKLGYEFMSGSRAHTNHRQCFTNEEVAPGIYADRCLSLRNHLACCDAKVNLSVSSFDFSVVILFSSTHTFFIVHFVSQNNEKCLGSSVSCISAHPTYARTLHSLCTCHTAEGNFSGSRCTFVHFSNVFSDASQIEKISPDPNGGGTIYRYIPGKLPSHDSDSQPPTEKLPTLDMIQQQISSLKIKSSSDDDALFNDNPVPTTFPQAARDSMYYFVCFDLETTGLTAKTSFIIDLAVSSLESANIHTGESSGNVITFSY